MAKETTGNSKIFEITKIINKKLELNEVLDYVTSAISEEIIQCDAVGIFLPVGDGTFRGSAGKPDFMNGMSIYSLVIDPETDLLAKELIETKKTIYIEDAMNDHRPNPQICEVLQIKSLLALPIIYKEEMLGMVQLFYFNFIQMDDSEIQSAEAYVNMAAIAIQNAKNLEQKEKVVSEKQLLLDANRELSACSSIEDCLTICFSYVRKIWGSRNAALHTRDSSNRSGFAIKKISENALWPIEDWTSGMNDKTGQAFEETLREVFRNKEMAIIPLDGKRRVLLFPMISRGKVLGVLTVESFFEKTISMNNPDIQLVQSILDATAINFDNLLQMEQLEELVDERTKELANANERVTDVIESITDGFFAVNKEWKFIYINKHQPLPKGMEPNDLIGKSIWDTFPELASTAMFEQFHKAMFDRIPVHFELSSDSGIFWQEMVAYPYDEGICCLSKNITEKKNFEKELKRLANLELIGHMAAGISHEIRNPMTTVRGFLQLLTMEDLGEHKKYFKLMIDELDRANSIITKFLAMGNINKSDLKKSDLNALIYDVAPLLEIDTINQNKLIDIQTSQIPELFLNQDEIKQLLINLCRNGLEAMEAGRTLSISTYMKEDGDVVLEVRDQGTGIEKDILEKLGTPFYTTKDNGTGLGLGVSYGIAARHNAKIEIETSPEGTVFYTLFKPMI